jgi:hypothetical protein
MRTSVGNGTDAHHLWPDELRDARKVVGLYQALHVSDSGPLYLAGIDYLANSRQDTLEAFVEDLMTRVRGALKRDEIAREAHPPALVAVLIAPDPRRARSRIYRRTKLERDRELNFGRDQWVVITQALLNQPRHTLIGNAKDGRKSDLRHDSR